MSGLFNKLLPKKIGFFRGEQPAPSKLNGIFAEIQNAFFILESFIGNGNDSYVSDDSERKMIHNLSNAMGNTEKLYKPVNRITTLELINKRYASNTTSYSPSTDILSIDSTLLHTAIPCEGKTGDEFGIYFSGKGIIEIAPGVPVVLGDTGSSAIYQWKLITIASDIAYIRLIKDNVTTNGFNIKSIYVAETTLGTYKYKLDAFDSKTFNKTYSIPKNNNKYWQLKTPCKWSNPALDSGNVTNTSAVRCGVKSCDYCIGNTFEYSSAQEGYGLPKCSGALAEDATTARTYAADNDADRSGYLTVQSPIITVSNKYMIKLKPINHYGNLYIKDEEIPQNKLMLYDKSNSASTMKYTIPIFATGRGDILYIKDIDPIKNKINSSYNKNFIVLGDYGVIDMIYDVMYNADQPVPLAALDPDTAIYA